LAIRIQLSLTVKPAPGHNFKCIFKVSHLSGACSFYKRSCVALFLSQKYFFFSSFPCCSNNMDSKISRRRIQKNLQNSFSRKRKTIFRKIDALYCLDSDIDEYYVLRRRGKMYIYASCETDSWPPTKEQIVSRSTIL
jgi:hypothetical protein